MEEIKVPRLRPYTPIYNQIIQDEGLRLQTRAVFMLMLSCPPGWDFTVRGMAKIAGVSKDTMAKMIRELEEAGYVQRQEQPREGGKFRKGGFAVVLPSPYLEDADEEAEAEGEEEEPCPNFSDTVNSPPPCPNLPCPKTSDKIINIKNNNKPLKPPRGAGRSRYKTAPEWKPERFDGLWKYYPRGENKQAAIRAWDRLRPSDELIDKMAVALKRQMQSRDWREGIGIPHLSTWLNNARWEEAFETRAPAGPDPGDGWAAYPEVMRHA